MLKLNKILKKAIELYVRLSGLSYKKKSLLISAHPSVSAAKIDEVKNRLNFFLGTDSFTIRISREKNLPLLFNTPIMAIGYKNVATFKKIYRGYIFDMDYDTNPYEAWEYHNLLFFLSEDPDYVILKASLTKFYAGISIDPLHQSYIFGTGSSLEKAISRNWSDGYRIVCNTIVKDKELWTHIDPHVITAGDAIYHFGIGNFAVNFREDLKKRLLETSTIFIYPAFFHPFCLREFKDFQDRLFPVPIKNDRAIYSNLMIDYSLPPLDNVLLLLLLPVGCSFSKTVSLWGFDGRSPNDKDFWKNSSKHFYQDDVSQLKELHPAFYNKLLPKSAPDSYAKSIHGDVLETNLSMAETNGFTFKMLHDTYTEVLAKRRYKE